MEPITEKELQELHALYPTLDRDQIMSARDNIHRYLDIMFKIAENTEGKRTRTDQNFDDERKRA